MAFEEISKCFFSFNLALEALGFNYKKYLLLKLRIKIQNKYLSAKYC